MERATVIADRTMNHAGSLADRIDALLPQTQCRRCGFEGCRPYAEAIASGEADVNRCPPGGETTLRLLARLVGRVAPPLDVSCGEPGPLQVARIDEHRCIGCTLCIAPCPVDAIVGAQKRLHGVLASRCTGCGLCLPPCPVDCIALVDARRNWTVGDAAGARTRYEQRNRRLAARARERARDPEANARATQHDARRRKEAIAAALSRARARRRVDESV